ncbi:MAG TPA: TM2 domain-containing protein [Chitinophagaceae bacterium]
MNQQQLLMMQGIQPDELALIQELMKDMSEAQQQQFLIVYSGKRKDQQTMLILCLVGILGIAGIHRLVSGDVVLGIVYLLTCGFCFIGTIIDAVNIRSITYEHNRKQAFESAQMVAMMVK